MYELDEGSTTTTWCAACGKVEEFYDPEIEKRQQLVAKTKGWVQCGPRDGLYGHCAECAKARSGH